ncbi:MAG: DNA polymerase II large subunit [Candidatus Bathyarchaeota archaeon]|nr:DNA polymerase II large subunit [Candidatus Bathyarchaeota archaeon]
MPREVSASYNDYISCMETELKQMYDLSDKARAKGLDPALKTECIIAHDIADLVEGLVGPKGVAASIRELNKTLGREEIAFKITEQIVHGKFGEMHPEEAAEQAIRTALAIFTEGLTAAPIQGVAQVKIKANSDQTRYLAIYFAGPIRSAGGTDQALTLVVGDHVRKQLGLDKYKPTPEEVSRFVEELRTFERSVGRFQYHIPDAELKKALDLIPVEVTGTESDPVEVSSYRNLPRIETNRVRGGALRVVNDGIVGRALKVLIIVEKLGFQGWDWLADFKKKKTEQKKSGGFMDDVIAGRPIFAFPSRRGGFRLRYGRARNTGLSAVGIHPATMLVVESFLAAGTQMRLELPGKGGVTMPVDTIEPPVVLLKDDSVVRVSTSNFKSLKGQIQKILFLGDILISFGDFLYTNKALLPSGYVEEWWIKDLKHAIKTRFNDDLNKAATAAGISSKTLENLFLDPLGGEFTVKDAFALSKSLEVPLYPRFNFFWSNLSSAKEVQLLKDWLSNSKVSYVDGCVTSITGELDENTATVLRKIYAPQKVLDGQILLEGEDACALACLLGYDSSRTLADSVDSVFEAVSALSGVEVRDKAPTFVGARMGRPEKAKRREMKPLVHVLFPVSLAGGSHRDLVEAGRKGPVFVETVKRKCPKCRDFTLSVLCPKCGCETEVEYFCPRCGRPLKKEVGCPECKAEGVPYQRQPFNFKKLIAEVSTGLGIPPPKQLRGVKGLTNEDKTPEIIQKGILRAKHNLSVYKDGTIRFDATNAPLTHIKPGEIGVSVEKLRQLGYTYDIHGAPLRDPEQILELKIQDIVIPWNAAEYFVHVANFIDELLERVYNLPRYYNVKAPEELVGHLVMGLAPHTCACILGRVVGFTNLKLIYAHPIWHSAKRRDCDGDEDAIILALDTLLNFSKRYLPAAIGGIMDAPMELIPFVNTREVQRQAHDCDVDGDYPLEMYLQSLKKTDAKQLTKIMDLVSHRLGTPAQFEGFLYTTPVSNVNMGNSESSYKQLKSMIEKLNLQLELGERIDAVDVRHVAMKVLTTHFIRDISGNLRAFSTQAFRCKSCNKRFRRLPLQGKCPFCGGKFTLTVYRGGIEKYLAPAQQMVDKYGLPNYYTQRMMLIKDELHYMFDNKKPKQASLLDFGQT